MENLSTGIGGLNVFVQLALLALTLYSVSETTQRSLRIYRLGFLRVVPNLAVIVAFSAIGYSLGGAVPAALMGYISWTGAVVVGSSRMMLKSRRALKAWREMQFQRMERLNAEADKQEQERKFK